MKGRSSLFESGGAKGKGFGFPFGKGNEFEYNNTHSEMSETGKVLLSQAKEDVTKRIIKELYRPGATIGDGGTADALKHEKQTGKKIGNKGHEIKAKERATQIKKILFKNPNHPDKATLKYLLNNLEEALKGD